MRDFNKPNKTHASNGEPLSEMFIGEDGLLSVFLGDDECEVVGYISTIFSDAFRVARK